MYVNIKLITVKNIVIRNRLIKSSRMWSVSINEQFDDPASSALKLHMPCINEREHVPHLLDACNTAGKLVRLPSFPC